MKKLLFIMSFVFLICACTKTEPEFTPAPTPIKQYQNISTQVSLPESLPVSITESSCKMGEYDCWDIVKDIKQLSKSNQEPYLALEKKGILIVYANVLQDGGSQFYTLSNGTNIVINYEMFSNRRGTRGYTTITDFISKKKITYNNEGKIVSTNNIFTESSCKIGKYDCWNIIQDIKKNSRKSASKEKASNPALEKKGLSILSYRKFEDGGSESYVLSNQVEIFIDYKSSSKMHGYTTISDHNTKKRIIYDKKGNIVNFNIVK